MIKEIFEKVQKSLKICGIIFMKSLPAVGRCVIRERKVFFQSFLKFRLTFVNSCSLNTGIRDQQLRTFWGSRPPW